MSRSLDKPLVTVVLTVFVLALASCLSACYADDVACVDDHSCECLCVCQTLAPSPELSIADQPLLKIEGVVAVPVPLKLRLIAASIFNPPKA